IQLGRRFRALKLWMLIRYFGVEGIAARIEQHCRMAGELAAWVAADSEWQVLAPVPFSTVCLRHRPADLAGQEDDPAVRARLDAHNEAVLERVNQSGDIFLSHTRLSDRFAIRVSLGNPRQRPDHVARCWSLLREAAAFAARRETDPAAARRRDP
ncbi:MAG TPA: pyridoxal-dependent decarboxylase, partial [Candidatus Polarisedimenticolia bacterium]|nr:pyridoxal-dependent decarboxylase [Candidatus Polarisedimenticolia bacterium]